MDGGGVGDRVDDTVSGHRGVRRYVPDELRIRVGRLKAAALLKAADFQLLTGEFDGDRITFEPWLTLLAERRHQVVSLGVYQMAFAKEDDWAARPLPDVAWRRVEWDRFPDIARFRAAPDKGAYLVGDTQVASQIRFAKLADQPQLAAAIRESIDTLAAGVDVVAARGRDTEWEYLRVVVIDAKLVMDLGYGLWTARSDVVERWATSWISLFASLDDAATIAPEGDLTVSYRGSFEELVGEVRRFPQPTVERWLAGTDPEFPVPRL